MSSEHINRLGSSKRVHVTFLV